MNIRRYNIYFHTHTISGILICAILYVMFFAGSFSFFREEITAWQSADSYVSNKEFHRDFDVLVDSLDKLHGMQGRDLSFYFVKNSPKVYVQLSPSKDTLASAGLDSVQIAKKKETAYFLYDFGTKNASTYQDSYDLAEFLYRLHFLAQLNHVPLKIGVPFGYMMAGLVSFLFLFALITGLLLHWDKLVSNFFLFRPWSKWKTVWTDMHTALGVIGYPFQFMYSVTGIVLIFNTMLIIPFTKYLYGNESEKIYEELGYADNEQFAYLQQPIGHHISLAYYYDHVQEKWPGGKVTRMYIKNYGDESMHVSVEVAAHPKISFSATGKITFRAKDNDIVYEKQPLSTYVDKVKALVYHLHFGDFGGYPVKITFFLLGIMGCLVITSGILIWLVARDKKNIPVHKRRFNFWAANVFISLCLTMLPVTALTFIAVKIQPHGGQDFIYAVFFYSWLVLTVFYVCRRNLVATNRETLLLGAVFGLIVPIANGILSGNWFWKTWQSGQLDIFFVDVFWIVLSTGAFVSIFKIKEEQQRNRKMPS